MKLEQHNDTTALVARLFMSSLFVLYGYFKLTGFAGTVAYMGRQGSRNFGDGNQLSHFMKNGHSSEDS